VIEAVVGFFIGSVLGLTGAGGAAFALPLLVLVVGLPVQQAIGLSLATVALGAGYGTLRRLSSGDIFWWAVLFLGLGGVVAAPLGKYLSTFVPDTWLLSGFTLMTLGIAWHMWRRSAPAVAAGDSLVDAAFAPVAGSQRSKLFDFDTEGHFHPHMRSVGALAVSGLGVGSLSGLFGIGGGFLVVPLLTCLVGVSMRRAIASSLLIITLISSAGFITHTLITPTTDWALLAKLGVGATVGMTIGSYVSERASPTLLQKAFAVGLIVLAVFTLGNVYLHGGQS